MKKWTVHLIPHTHWDREWYFTEEESDVLLERNLEDLILVLEKDEKFLNFNFDGQTSLMSDYLEHNPEKTERINKLFADSRLLTGPSFVQPDFFNSGAESIIRNMELGAKFMKNHGVPKSYTMYNPDSFGFIENYPSFLKAFGFDQWIFWRGMASEQIEKSILNKFVAPNGDFVYGYNFLHGYSGFAENMFPIINKFSTDPNDLSDDFFKKITQELFDFMSVKLKEIKKKCGTVTNYQILVPYGADQFPVLSFLPLLLEKFNEMDEENEWIMSNNDAFFRNIVRDNVNNEIKGVVRKPCRARVHRTISSSRADLKILLNQLETLLYLRLEPLKVIFDRFKGDFSFQGILDNAIGDMIKCIAHDSLGGCNSDRTNDNITNRMRRVMDIFNTIRDILIYDLCYYLNISLGEGVLFNYIPHNDVRIYSFDIVSEDPHFSLYINDERTREYSIVKRNGFYDDKFYDTDLFPDLKYEYYLITVAAKIKIPWMSWAKIKILTKPDDQIMLPTKTILVPEKKHSVENKFYKITIHGNYVHFYDKKRNVEYKNAFFLDAFFDKGDLYDYSPSKIFPNSIIKKVKIKKCYVTNKNMFQCLRVTYNAEYYGDEELTEIKNQDFVIKFYVYRDSQTIYIRIKTQNKSIDTKWVAVLKDVSEHNESQSYLQFMDTKNDTEFQEKEWRQKAYQETSAAIFQNSGAVFFKNKNSIFTTFNKATKEYTHQNKKIIYTLFRTPRFLGRKNLLWRPGRPSGTATFAHATPKSTLQRELTFKLGFSILDREEEIQREMLRFLGIYYFHQKQNKYFFGNKIGNFHILRPKKCKLSEITIHKAMIDIHIDNLNLGISNIRSISKNIIMVRLYNPTHSNEKVNIFGKSVIKIEECLATFENAKPFKNSVSPYSFVTLLVHLKPS